MKDEGADGYSQRTRFGNISSSFSSRRFDKSICTERCCIFHGLPRFHRTVYDHIISILPQAPAQIYLHVYLMKIMKDIDTNTCTNMNLNVKVHYCRAVIISLQVTVGPFSKDLPYLTLPHLNGLLLDYDGNRIT